MTGFAARGEASRAAICRQEGADMSQSIKLFAATGPALLVLAIGGTPGADRTPASTTSGTACAAGRPYCYDTPVHLNPLINTSGFEGKPSLSADGLELYFVSDRPGALGGPGDAAHSVTRGG